MPPTEHAKLTPSAAYRWMNCPGSVHLEKDVSEPPSEFAQEGSLAHRLAEVRIFEEIRHGKTSYAGWDNLKDSIIGFYESAKDCRGSFEEMNEYVQSYLDYVRSVLPEEIDLENDIDQEKQFDLSSYIPDGFGTADLVIHEKNALHVIDFKYGKGIPVYAEDNDQLKIYALGALEDASFWGENVDQMELSIYQPRNGGLRTTMLSSEELLDWGRTVLRPAAQYADTEPVKGDYEFQSGGWCRFCKGKVNCPKWKKRAEMAAEDAETARVDTETLERLLPIRKDLKSYFGALEKEAIARLEAGETLKGMTLGSTTPRSRWADNVDESGIDIRDKNGKPMSVKKAMETLSPDQLLALDPFIIKPQGKAKIIYK